MRQARERARACVCVWKRKGRMATEFRLIPFWDCRIAGGVQTSASITTSDSEKGLAKPQWPQRDLSRLSWNSNKEFTFLYSKQREKLCRVKGKEVREKWGRIIQKVQMHNGSLNCIVVLWVYSGFIFSFKQKVLFIIIDANNKSGMQTVTVWWG